jgi:methyl-accepting chemotaxis protein
MLSDQKDKLQVATKSMAVSLGEMIKGVNDEKAVEIIRNAIDSIRFEEDKSGYFFVYKGTVNVALPTKKESQGQDLAGLVDKNGVPFVREIARQAEKGGGFVEYVFPKPGKGDQPKLSYAEMIPGTKYWIGTGVYIDNINEAKAGMRAAIEGVARGMTSTILMVMAAVFVVVVLPVSWLLIQSIVRPIKAATRAASQVAAGNLDIALQDEGASEVGILNRAIENMVGTLRSNIAEITAKTDLAEEKARASEQATREAEEARLAAERAKAEGMLHAAVKLEDVVEIITSASEQLSAQIEQSSRGAEEQSGRVGETATAMEEMNSTVMEVAKNASQAAESADNAKGKAEGGADIVARVIQGIGDVQQQALGLKSDMLALGQQAESIGQVLNVISDIADQTNLLALNAAIEAARAGEAGRGFAVVADEVRKLAEKTMTATREVGEAIRGIQDGAKKNIGNVELAVGSIDAATGLAGQSGDSLKEIVGLVDVTSEQVRSIATAAEEQSATSEEINRSIEDIRRISAETSDGMRQSAQAVGELANQALVLKGLIADMKGGDDDSIPSRSRALAGAHKALPGKRR